MQYSVARSSAPPCYPPRVKLDPCASWDKLPDGYAPVEFTDSSVLANAEDLQTGKKWADVERPSLGVLGTRKSFAAGDSSSLDTVATVDQITKRFRKPGRPGRAVRARSARPLQLSAGIKKTGFWAVGTVS